MKCVIAGSRSISERVEANYWALNTAVLASGFHTTVVNLHNYKQPDYVYVGRGRGSVWGNPFSHMDQTLAKFRVKTRDEAIERYKEWFMEQPELWDRLPELAGKRLGCWCVPAACHASWLAELAGTITEVISGTAGGVDRLGEIWAQRNGIALHRMPADWDRLGRSAGYRRNEEMAKVGDCGIILWDGVSRGSAYMRQCLEKLGKPCYVHTHNPASLCAADSKAAS